MLGVELPHSVLALALDELSFWMSWARTESRLCHAHGHVTLGSLGKNPGILSGWSITLGEAQRCIL